MPSTDMFYGASPTLFKFARNLRDNETDAEKLLWTRISKKQIHGLHFRRQHPIVYFIADFYSHSAKLVIEVDGGIHLDRAQYRYDRERDHELSKFGLRVLRFTNDEVVNDLDSVIARIRNAVTPIP
jgi:cyclase